MGRRLVGTYGRRARPLILVEYQKGIFEHDGHSRSSIPYKSKGNEPEENVFKSSRSLKTIEVLMRI
jgi:hypothetical protein